MRAGSSVIYLFVTSTLQVHPPRSSQGVERVETAASPNGRRTLWYQARVSFSPAGGLEGTFVGNVSVLPDRRALLLTISHYCCDYADGQDFYELRSPLGQPRLLGTVLNASAVPTVGPSGTFAFGGGGDRYAWVSKHVEQCVRGHRHLHQGASPGKRALCLTGLVPQQAYARFCRSERRAKKGAIGQPQVLRLVRHTPPVPAGGWVGTDRSRWLTRRAPPLPFGPKTPKASSLSMTTRST